METTRTRTTIWARCNLHPSEVAGDCNRCRTATDVNAQNQARCPVRYCRSLLAQTVVWGVLACTPCRVTVRVSDAVVR